MAHNHGHGDHDHEHEFDEVDIIEDEEGNEYEVVDFEFEGRLYAVLFPLDDPEESGILVRREIDDAGQEVLTDIEDEDEFERVVAFLEAAEEEGEEE